MTPLDFLLWTLVVAVAIALVLFFGLVALVIFMAVSFKPWRPDLTSLEPLKTPYLPKARRNGHYDNR